jgi:hypothetical protein
VADVERAAAGEEGRGDDQVAERLLDVEALEDVERGERDEQRDRAGTRAGAGGRGSTR